MVEVKAENVAFQRKSLDTVVSVLDAFFPDHHGVESSGTTVVPPLGYECELYQEYIVEGSTVASVQANLVQGQPYSGRYVGSVMLNISETIFEKVLKSFKSCAPEVYSAIQSVNSRT